MKTRKVVKSALETKQQSQEMTLQNLQDLANNGISAAKAGERLAKKFKMHECN